MEERSVICGNALEEARGKEVELATDYIISHTLQTLLEGCSVEHLCGFLRSSAKDFSHIAMDRSGSHVAETALKSLAMHQDIATDSLIEGTLSRICKVSSFFITKVTLNFLILRSLTGCYRFNCCTAGYLHLSYVGYACSKDAYVDICTCKCLYIRAYMVHVK